MKSYSKYTYVHDATSFSPVSNLLLLCLFKIRSPQICFFSVSTNESLSNLSCGQKMLAPPPATNKAKRLPEKPIVTSEL